MASGVVSREKVGNVIQRGKENRRRIGRNGIIAQFEDGGNKRKEGGGCRERVPREKEMKKKEMHEDTVKVRESGCQLGIKIK